MSQVCPVFSRCLHLKSSSLCNPDALGIQRQQKPEKIRAERLMEFSAVPYLSINLNESDVSLTNP